MEDTIYEAITESPRREAARAADIFIEEYETDPVTTPEDKFVIQVFVPVK